MVQRVEKVERKNKELQNMIIKHN
jgi:hypothetical protein